ncbi:hypothetical protein O7630_04945 [Micromonospora sp. WMMD718]|nr:hypothetical protein [Micromonospora sp. WMMD718]MDG4750276.1 hypothetical protein [Micromonospora sp. WMMD718]
MPQNPLTEVEPSYAHAVTVLATALDSLGARIYRDLHIESTDLAARGVDPQVTAMLTSFSTYAEDCLAVLDDPAVRNALDAAMAHRPARARLSGCLTGRTRSV